MSMSTADAVALLQRATKRAGGNAITGAVITASKPAPKGKGKGKPAAGKGAKPAATKGEDTKRGYTPDLVVATLGHIAKYLGTVDLGRDHKRAIRTAALAIVDIVDSK